MATGDIVYRDTSVWKRLVANSTSVNKFLRSVSSGVPSWQALVIGDIPTPSSVILSSTGTVNNYAPGSNVGIIRCTNTSALTLTGMVAGYDGEIRVFIATDAQVDFVYNSGSSSTGNKFYNTIATINTSIVNLGGGHVVYQYETTSGYWRLVTHVQGSSIVFSPTWAGSISNPAIGNGTNVASYTINGKLVTLTYNILMGSTTTFGSGYWTLTTPASANTVGLNRNGSILCYDNSLGVGKSGVSTATVGTSTVLAYESGGNPVDATHPFTWATDDLFRMSIVAEFL